MAYAIEVEIERNYAAFKDIMPTLLADSEGQYALLRDQELKGVYPSASEAERAGHAQFQDERYSIQQVSSMPIDLGFYSYALAQG